MPTLAFAFSVTAPIFVMVLLGLLLKKYAIINDEFVRMASGLVFNIGLPVMLFTSTATRDYSQLVNLTHIVALVLAVVIVFILSSITAPWHLANPRDRGVLVQGAFRGNLMIVGLAFCANAYGEEGLAIAALPVAILIVVHNVLSVYTLTRSLDNSRQNLPQTLTAFVKNPLIIGIASGLCANLLHLRLPALVLETSRYLGQMTLPLALICIGGALNLTQLRDDRGSAIIASTWKLLLTPALLLALAVPLKIRGIELGVLFLLAACPSATASFVLVKAMGGNGELAAKIVVLSTAASLFTVTGGLLMLKSWGLI